MRHSSRAASAATARHVGASQTTGSGVPSTKRSTVRAARRRPRSAGEIVTSSESTPQGNIAARIISASSTARPARSRLQTVADSEGDNLADSDLRGMLASIGHRQGQPFNPDAHTRAVLDLVAKTAYKMSRVVGFEQALGDRLFIVYPDRHWLKIRSPMARRPIRAAPWIWPGTESRATVLISTPVFGSSPITTRSVRGRSRKFLPRARSA
jgi:hypothetical protein